MQGSVAQNDRSRLAKGVARHAKFILKTISFPKILVLQTRPYSEWPAPTHYLQTRCVRPDEGERASVSC